MAEENKKKRTRKKSEETPKETENTEVQSQSAEETEETPKKTTKKAKTRSLSADDPIEVMNNTTGRYVYRSRSGYGFEMNGYGDIVEVPFKELKQMRGEQRKNLDEAYIVILNDDAVKELGYEEKYENVLDEDGVSRILQDPDKLDSIIDDMPKNMKKTVGAIAIQKFKNREIDSLRVRDTLQDKLNIDIEKHLEK